jgi:hypothetical protein
MIRANTMMKLHSGIMMLIPPKASGPRWFPTTTPSTRVCTPKNTIVTTLGSEYFRKTLLIGPRSNRYLLSKLLFMDNFVP